MSKLTPDSDSTQKTVSEKCHCFQSTISKNCGNTVSNFPKKWPFFLLYADSAIFLVTKESKSGEDNLLVFTLFVCLSHSFVGGPPHTLSFHLTLSFSTQAFSYWQTNWSFCLPLEQKSSLQTIVWPLQLLLKLSISAFRPFRSLCLVPSSMVPVKGNVFAPVLQCTIAIRCRWAANRFFKVKFTWVR